jgi:hypothetical protein
VFDRLDFLLKIRIGRKPAILGLVFLGTLVLSVLLFLFVGNGLVSRVMYFPSIAGRHKLLAEQRAIPRHGSLEMDVTELAEGVLLGPMNHDATRLFPRGATVLSAMMNGRTLYLDLSPQVLTPDPDAPLKAQDALNALSRAVKFNFPRVRDVVFFIDGQLPRFAEKKKI